MTEQDNNGWTKIETDNDLPTDWETVWVYSEGYIYYAVYNPTQEYFRDENGDVIGNVTHYQLLNKPKNPLY